MGYRPPWPRPGPHTATSALSARKDHRSIIRPRIPDNPCIRDHRHYRPASTRMIFENPWFGHHRDHPARSTRRIPENPCIRHSRHYPARTTRITRDSARIAHHRYHRSIMPPPAAKRPT